MLLSIAVRLRCKPPSLHHAECPKSFYANMKKVLPPKTVNSDTTPKTAKAASVFATTAPAAPFCSPAAPAAADGVNDAVPGNSVSCPLLAIVGDAVRPPIWVVAAAVAKASDAGRVMDGSTVLTPGRLEPEISWMLAAPPLRFVCAMAMTLLSRS